MACVLALATACAPAPIRGAPTPASIWEEFAYDGTYIIEVDPPVSLQDTPLQIRIHGLKAGQPVTLRATATDQASQAWESFATFRADAQGVVDVSRAAPLDGTYAKADGMGLFWSMRPLGTVHPESIGFAWSRPDPVTVRLSLEASGRSLTSVEIKRLPILSDRVTREPIRLDGIAGTLFYPNAPGKYPAVIVLGGSDGGLSEERARLIASHGFVTFALAYFRFESLPDQLVEIPLEYFAHAINRLKAHPSVNGEQIVVMGQSKGGEAALLLGSTFPQDIKAVVAYAPSAVVFQGIDVGQAMVSSWSLAGKPLPFVKFALTPECTELALRSPPVNRCLYDEALNDSSAVDAAGIPVEKINGPVLLISGTDDQVWPSSRMSEMIVARLKASHFGFAYESLSYEGAGHFIGIPYLPANRKATDRFYAGGTAEANAYASADSWSKMLEFLDRAFPRAE